MLRKIFDLFKEYNVFASYSILRNSNNHSKNRFPFALHKKASYVISPKANITLNENAYFRFGLASGYKFCRPSFISISDNSNFICDGGFSMFDNAYVIVRKNSTLKLGSGYINSNSQIVCSEKIEIGNGVAIADGVLIRDSDDHDIEIEGYKKTKPIKIGNHVWIGQKVTILKGVTIGDNSIIAAGAVVTGDIPENCIAAGVPARVIRTNTSWK